MDMKRVCTLHRVSFWSCHLGIQEPRLLVCENLKRLGTWHLGFDNMEWLSAIILVFLSTRCVAQPTQVTLVTTTDTVTEGTNNVMTWTCTLDAPAVVELNFALAIDDKEASNTEDGFDHPMVSGFCCTVAVGSTVGTVDIPLMDDVIIDFPTTGEMLVVKIDDLLGLTDNTLASAATVTITDDGDAEKIRIIPRDPVIKTVESSTQTTATITLDFVDANGAPAAIEEAISLAIAQVNAALDTAETADFTDPGTQTVAAPALITSGTVTVIIVPDNAIENIETVDFVLVDPMTPVGTITAEGSSPIQIQIADDDRTELIALQDMTPMGMGRSSKKEATIWAISNERSSKWDVTDSTLGHNLRDCKRKLRTVGANKFRALELTVPRPERNSKARYNEFTFIRNQQFAGQGFDRTVRAYVTPSSNKNNNDAAIETNVESVLVVYPHKDGCPALKENHCINVTCTSLNRRQLRWSFIPEGGSESDEKILKKYNGKDRISINACGMAGLYIVGRSGRRKNGWVDYVRVIQAACPCDQYVDGTCRDTQVGGCRNQGVLDQTLNLCTCRPGFGGENCELAMEPGVFGQNCQFKVEDYFKKKKNSMKCLKFNFPDTFGSTCAAGFTGKDCCDKCKRGWNYGANCGQTCHCVDDMCDPVSGRCTNGCASGYKGSNCQVYPPRQTQKKINPVFG